MSAARSAEWTARLDGLNDEARSLARVGDYVGAAQKLSELRGEYDAWARECFGVKAEQAQAQSDCEAPRRAWVGWNVDEPLLEGA
jgi:hypothetical protein